MTASRGFVRMLGFFLTTVLLSACGDGIGASPATQSVQTSPLAPAARTGNLLYVADLNAGDVYVFSYPGGRLRRKLTGFQAVHYLCVDGAGHIFVDDTGASKVLEYDRTGTQPIHTFKTPNATPNSCAIDPATGNLAISYNPLGDGPGAVDVYKRATGKRTTYTTPNVFRYYFIGYDNAGNLFIDGTDMHVTFELAELPAGGQTTQAITMGTSVSLPGAIAWDGQYLAIGDQVCIECASQIDRVSVSGTTATLVGTVALLDSCDVLQYWIDKGRVIAADDCGSTVKYFNYPAGGNSLKTIASPLNEPVGVTVSPK